MKGIITPTLSKRFISLHDNYYDIHVPGSAPLTVQFAGLQTRVRLF